MFEPISENLTQLMGFVILGFFLAAFYEPLRIIRLFKRQGALIVGIQDFLFFSLAGIISFAYSMELGAGSFRLFYFTGEFFGAVLYFITAGKLISMISDVIVRAIKWCVKFIKKHIFEPVLHIITKLFKYLHNKLANIYNLSVKKVKNILKDLKQRVKIVYNRHKLFSDKKNNGMKNKGKSKNVIKAKIRTNSN